MKKLFNKKNKIIILSVFTIIPVIFFLYTSCKNEGGVNYQIAIERTLINGKIKDTDPKQNDSATPVAMNEDDEYFYVTTNIPWRAKKLLTHPEGCSKTPYPEPNEDNRIINEWQLLDQFGETGFTDLTHIVCRALITFDGQVYGSFSNDALSFRTNKEYSDYNKILKLDNPKAENPKWINASFPEIKIESAPIDLPNQPGTATAEQIDPDDDLKYNRLFSYSDDLSPFEEIDTKILTKDEQNALAISAYFETNQIRLPEAINFYKIDGKLFVLYNDAYIKDRIESAPISHAKIPIYRLFEVKTPSTAPTLQRISSDRIYDTDKEKTDRDLLNLIKTRMTAETETFSIARAKVVRDEMFHETTKNENPDITLFNSSGEQKSFTQNANLFLPDSFQSYFKRAVQVDTEILFLNKEGLYQLDIGSTPAKLNNITEIKLPKNYNSGTTENPVNYLTYRYMDLSIYKDNIGNWHSVIIAAMNDSANKKSANFVFKYDGKITNITSEKDWTEVPVKIRSTIASNNTSQSSQTIFNAISPYFNDNFASIFFEGQEKVALSNKQNRSIANILFASNKGYYENSYSMASDINFPNAPAGLETNHSYLQSIPTIALINSFISDFYLGTAKIEKNEGVFQEVPVLFALTAGNGLWINYNRFWNRE